MAFPVVLCRKGLFNKVSYCRSRPFILSLFVPPVSGRGLVLVLPTFFVRLSFFCARWKTLPSLVVRALYLFICVGVGGGGAAAPGVSRALAIEIAAHSRAINAIDLHPSSMLVRKRGLAIEVVNGEPSHTAAFCWKDLPSPCCNPSSTAILHVSGTAYLELVLDRVSNSGKRPRGSS